MGSFNYNKCLILIQFDELIRT